MMEHGVALLGCDNRKVISTEVVPNNSNKQLKLVGESFHEYNNIELCTWILRRSKASGDSSDYNYYLEQPIGEIPARLCQNVPIPLPWCITIVSRRD